MAEVFFIQNREKLFQGLSENSVLILFAGEAPFKRGDEKYPFSPDRNFYYTTGISDEKAIFVLTKMEGKKEETLYIQRSNNALAKWIGKNKSREEALAVSGINTIKYIDEFEENLSDMLFKNKPKLMYIDLEKREWQACPSKAILFAGDVKQKYPSIIIEDIYGMFASMRVIKQKYELELIKKAVDITKLGIEEMMKNARPGMAEYEMEAYFDFVLKKNGVREKAFQTIAASGKNATVLHYVENSAVTKQGDLILCDVGAQVGFYNGDLTRTFPVGGKFSKRQKEIYNIVLEGQQKVIAAIRPGTAFSSLNEILKEHYFCELKKLGLVDKMEDVSRYYYHGVSHYLGAETHDVGREQQGILCEGAVLTVEPGLYIEEFEIGIRIEDDVLVTSDGCEVLSIGLAKTVDEIEDFMARGIKK